MFTFEKGDPENLKGRAVLYIHNTGGDDSNMSVINPKYISNVIGPYPSAVFEIIEAFGPLPDELKQSIEEKYRKDLEDSNRNADGISRDLEYFEKLLESISTKYRNGGMGLLDSFRRFSKKGILYCNALIVGENPIKVIESRGMEYDQIKLMDVSNIITANEVLASTSKIYMIMAEEHMLRKVKTGNIKSGMKSYGEMTRDEFGATLSSLMSKLMLDIETGTEPLQIFADLKQIARGSPFLDDIISSFGLSKAGDESSIELLKLINERIYAVLDERYEDATEITKRMRKLGFKG